MTMEPIFRRLFEGPGLMPLRILLDVGVLALATAGSLATLNRQTPPNQIWWLFPAIAVVALALGGLYRRTPPPPPRELLGVGKATALAAIATLALASLLEPGPLAAAPLVAAWGLGTAAVVACRLLLTLAGRSLRKRGGGTPTLIVGAGRIGAQVEHELRERPELGLRPVGFLDADPAPEPIASGREAPVLGPPSQIERIVRQTGAEHVVVAFTSAPDSLLSPLLRSAQPGVQVSLVPRLFEGFNGGVELEHLVGLPLVALRPTGSRRRRLRPRPAAPHHQLRGPEGEGADEIPSGAAGRGPRRAAPVSGRLRVVIADDHVPTRTGVRLALEQGDMLVCAEAPSAQAAVSAALRERPDVCLLDINMPGNGIKAAAEISARLPETAVVMLTVSSADEDIFDSLRAGARGYLLKDMDPARLPAALRGVLAGEAALPPRARRSRN
jgi:CheY-like chemotaxis protein